MNTVRFTSACKARFPIITLDNVLMYGYMYRNLHGGGTNRNGARVNKQNIDTLGEKSLKLVQIAGMLSTRH